MLDTFEQAVRLGAALLDDANLHRSAHRLMSHVREVLALAGQNGIDLGYDAPAGSEELRDLVAESERQLGSSCITARNVVVNPGGVTGAFDNLFRYLARQADRTGRNEVVVPFPVYPDIPKSASYNGLQVVPVKTRFEEGFQPTARALARKVARRTACVFLTSPGNPCCHYLPGPTLLDAVRLAERADTVLALDAIFEEATADPRPAPLFCLSDYPRLVKIKGFSKDRPFMNDLRIGWSVCRCPYVINGLFAVTRLSDFCLSRSLTAVALAELRLRTAAARGEDGEALALYRAEVSTYHSSISRGLERVRELLDSSGVFDRVCHPEAGNILFLRVSPAVARRRGLKDDAAVFRHLLETAKVGVTPGHVFHAPPGERWLRITLAWPVDTFVEHVERMVRALDRPALRSRRGARPSAPAGQGASGGVRS